MRRTHPHQLLSALCLWSVLLGGSQVAWPAAATGAGAQFRLVRWPAGAPSPAFSLRDAGGRVRTLADFRGRPLVVFFGYTHCPDACPTELFQFARVIRDLGPLDKAPQVLFITLDPERDTPALLASYVSSFNPDFIGLSGSATQVQRAADSFGVQFARVRQGADYGIDHSTATYLFDRHGRLRLIGALDSSNADLVHDLKALLAER